MIIMNIFRIWSAQMIFIHMNNKINMKLCPLFIFIYITFTISVRLYGEASAQTNSSTSSDRESVQTLFPENYLLDIAKYRQNALNGSAGNRSPLEAAYFQVGRWDLRPDDVHTVILADGLAEDCAALRETSRSVAAAGWLGSRLDGIRVLMFNENHADPGPRWFLSELLPLLHDHGFRHLGLEALDVERPLEPPAAILSAAPRAAINEPVYIGLIRKALSLNFSVFGYDRFETEGWQDKDMFDRILTREAGQAAVLAERIAAVPEDEKIVVLGGFTHITKDWHYLDDGRRLGWMAAQFQERTGLEPLSIDLVTCPVEVGARARLGDARIYLGGGEEPAMVGPYAGRVDAQFHIPAGGSLPGTFRHAMGQAWHLPAGSVPRGDMILLEAYASDAPAEALPYDRLMLEPGEDFPLFLPPGRYLVRVTDSSGAILAEIDVSMER